ncbi:asparagine--tRNA ligase [candidate division FCPU426 bacterium]|nr:asparagine--tRNA ligase [candidate division FCPU426 bacterium]
MNDQSIKTILSLSPQGQTVRVCGWVRTKRESKTFSFLEINDGSCLRNIQVVVDEKTPDYKNVLNRLTTGASVEVTGVLAASQGGGQASEIQAAAIVIHGPADPQTYPLQKKHHSFEFLREIAHLRPRTNTLGAMARIRNALSMAVHQFFQERGFIYLHTPVIAGSDCEGAGEMFQVTTLPLENIPRQHGQVDYSQDFFKKKTGLTVSGQLEGEIYACALGRIYTFGPTFRAEHSDTSRHLAEFWMVEPEMAFCDIHQNMDMAEAFVKYICKYVLDHCQEDMFFFNRWVDTHLLDTLENVVQAEFVRITYSEAVQQLEKSGAAFEYPVSWGKDLQSEHEKHLTEHIFRKPVMVTDYPKQIKAFYMKMNQDGKTVRALDLHVPRLGEIIGGSERENDYDLLQARILELGLNPADYWWYLDLRRYGSVPHSGFGLGFERAVQFVTGLQNIRDVIPFPRTYGSAEF